MTETYLVLLAGGTAGLIAAFIGGFILYRNRLQTHLTLRERVEQERTALQADIAEMDKEELAETDAGKALMRFSQASLQHFGYARQDPTASLRRHNLDLLKQIEEERKKFAQSEERLAAMAVLQQESQKVIESLKKDNEKLWLESSLKKNVSSTNAAQLEQELRVTLSQVARLQNQLAETNMRLLEMEAGGTGAFSQELHQTLSAALGSIDLLLDESTGRLNPMQRNLLETIKASTARLNSVIGDLIQVTTRKVNSQVLLDLNSILKDAIVETSSQISAKRISLRVDVPKRLPSVYADREALGQILIRLLSNAGAASPLQGTMQLRAETKVEDGKEHLLIQVSDSGGGIPAEDLPRVFVPLYHETDIPARGVGETGMGLFIAKTLIEAQNGKIWVETKLGVGSTYNVLLPIDKEKPVNVSADE